MSRFKARQTIANPAQLTRLIERLGALHPDTPREWGTLNPGEMLCHLSDASASVMVRDSSDSSPHRFLKWLALSAPIAWPRGLETPPGVDPKADGTRPGDFEADRRRAIAGLQALAEASASDLATSHSAFGPMTARDWHRWAYRHTDHHLRQFGL